ncbi:Alpha/Beta hydrolase protein [Scheffersomyces coipomensis]|uniref:Alpha/Beta hydrolase protein n=1 Tax=Scheffersomyces coipomensis TaxID=1788519 RepID=UPI00315CABD2
MLSNDVYILPPDLTNCQYNPHGSDNSWKQDHHYVGQLLDVPINDDLTIHEFYLENNIPADQPVEETHIVMIHGYMAAVGYFIKNIETLLRSKPGVRLHLIDLPGFGNSSRPQFPSEYLLEPSTKAEKISQVLEVEDWFIDKIENWRSVRNISKFKLIGHSMGAYLSSCYLLKYNHGTEQFVDQFIIVSPMGTESSPNSLISNKKYEFSTHNVGGNPFKELDVFEDDDYINKLWTEMGQPKIPKSVFLETLWKYKKSPFQVLQYFGPFYSKILSYWSFRRFRNLKKPPIDRALILKLHNYSYSIFNQYTGSGELAITKLISHEILAKLPLGERGFIEYLVKNQVKTLWIYGDKDWMNENGGLYINDKVNESISKLSTHKIIKDAGHHIYLDNPVDFNKTAIEFFNLSN